MAKKSDPAEGDVSTEEVADGKPRIGDHPRARHSIARARAWGALLGFGIAAYVGNHVSLPFVDLVVRAILIGALTSLVVWAGAQAIWRQIIFAEIAIARKAAVEQQRELIEAIEDPGGESKPR